MRIEGEIATNIDPTGLWSLVVPLKPLAQGKSRLTGAAGVMLRPRLALAFAQDTVVAALSCRAVRDVVVVTDDPVARRRSRRSGRAPCPTNRPRAQRRAGPRRAGGTGRGRPRRSRLSTRTCPHCAPRNWPASSISQPNFLAHL